MHRPIQIAIPTLVRAKDGAIDRLGIYLARGGHRQLQTRDDMPGRCPGGVRALHRSDLAPALGQRYGARLHRCGLAFVIESQYHVDVSYGARGAASDDRASARINH